MKRVNGWICFVFLIMGVYLLSGCSSDSDEKDRSIVISDVSQKDQNFNASDVAGSFSFVATTSWTATIAEVTASNRNTNNSPNWISLNKYSGDAGEHTLNITLTPNNTGKTRTATITVATGSEEIVVTVTQKSTNENGEEIPSEEYEWVNYKELSMIDDGQDYMLSNIGHYLYFKSPGFFQGGKGGEGQRMYLLDCGETSWKDFSVRNDPAWDKDVWIGEVVECVKGHGYFSAITYHGDLDDKRLARFWVVDYIMKGGEIVGAKIKYHDSDYDNLIFMNEKDNKKSYSIGHQGSSWIHNLLINIKSGVIVGGEIGFQTMYLYDAGSKATYGDFAKEYNIPAYNEATWTQEITPVKGHGYYVRSFHQFNDEIRDGGVASFYVQDDLIINGEKVGVIIRCPYLD